MKNAKNKALEYEGDIKKSFGTYEKALIKAKYHKLRSGKGRQQQHEEAMNGKYK